MNGQGCLSHLLELSEGKKEIEVFSDIQNTATAYYQNMNMYEAIHSNNDNSFINRWGNYEVLRTNDLYDFVKKDLKLTTYNYNEKYYGDLYNAQNVDTELGFVAQDIVGTSVENLVLRKDDADNLAYNLNGYVSVLAGALQKTIDKVEKLEKALMDNNIPIPQ